MNERAKASDALLLVAFLLSGAASLGYEILWTRLLSVALGSDILAVFGVLAGFFGGLAVGAAALQPLTRRVADPLRLFALLEGAAALFAAASPRLLYSLAGSLPGLGTGHGSALALLRAVGISAIALLPATICLGGTLAAMVEARRRARPDDLDGRGLGRLYGANTLGAMIGTLLAVYFVLPVFGFVAGACLLASIGAAAAIIALFWGQRTGLAKISATRARRRASASKGWEPRPRWLLHTLAFGTGFVGVGFEVVGVKVLAQGLENTIFTFANILAVYLGCTAIGAWIYARLAERADRSRYHLTIGTLLFALAVSVVLAAVPLRFSPELLAAFAPPGTSYGRQLAGELLVALSVFAAPTLLMGALFSHLVGALSDRATGYAYGLNTIGAALAPFVFGLFAIPKLQYTGAYYLVAYGYLGLFALHAFVTHAARLMLPLAILIVVGLDFAAPASLSLVVPPPGWRLVERREGLFGAVLVIERALSPGSGAPGPRGELRTPERRLQLGRRYRMGGLRSFGERRMGHVPLLLAQGRRQVLFLGVGTGATLGTTLSYRLQRVDAVELVPEVLASLPRFAAINQGVFKAPRVHFHAGDGRRFVGEAPRRWDLVVADLFHPARDGAASLFSVEHFRGIRDKLEPGGLFVQWLPLYQFAPDDLRLVVRTFLGAFERAHSFLGLYSAEHPILALVGQRGDGTKLAINLARLRKELAQGDRRRFVQGARDLFGSYMLDRSALARFAGEGELNSDLAPHLTFSAPRAAYEKRHSLAWESLAALLPLRVPCPPGLIAAPRAEKEIFLSEVGRWSAAVQGYLEGNLLRARKSIEVYPPGAINRLIDAYKSEPRFPPACKLLLQIARQDPQAESIYRRMLARTPDSARVKAAYALHLRRRGQHAKAAEMLKTLPHSPR